MHNTRASSCDSRLSRFLRNSHTQQSTSKATQRNGGILSMLDARAACALLSFVSSDAMQCDATRRGSLTWAARKIFCSAQTSCAVCIISISLVRFNYFLPDDPTLDRCNGLTKRQFICPPRHAMPVIDNCMLLGKSILGG